MVNNDEGNIYIGIASEKTPNTNITDVEQNIYYGFSYKWKFSQTKSAKTDHEQYGGFDTGDIVSIILDLKKAEIKLAINGTTQETAFTNVEKSDNTSYSLFVSLYNIGDCVEIVNFVSVDKLDE